MTKYDSALAGAQQRRTFQGALRFYALPGAAHRFALLTPGYLPPLFQREEVFT